MAAGPQFSAPRVLLARAFPEVRLATSQADDEFPGAGWPVVTELDKVGLNHWRDRRLGKKRRKGFAVLRRSCVIQTREISSPVHAGIGARDSLLFFALNRDARVALEGKLRDYLNDSGVHGRRGEGSIRRCGRSDCRLDESQI